MAYRTYVTAPEGRGKLLTTLFGTSSSTHCRSVDVRTYKWTSVLHTYVRMCICTECMVKCLRVMFVCKVLRAVTRPHMERSWVCYGEYCCGAYVRNAPLRPNRAWYRRLISIYTHTRRSNEPLSLTHFKSTGLSTYDERTKGMTQCIKDKCMMWNYAQCTAVPVCAHHSAH